MDSDDETVIRLDPNRATSKQPPTFRIRADSYTDLAEAAERAMIAASVPLYRRGNRLVSPAIREVEGIDGLSTFTAMLLDVGADYLREFLDRSANFESYSQRSKKWFAVSPPRFLAELILSRPAQWQFRDVAGIVTAPTLDPKGRLVSEPGYDSATRLFLTELPVLPQVALRPSKEDAERALADLNGLLAEFEFADEASRSVALSAMITLVCRGAIPLAPMHAASAPTPGSGKSYVFDIASVIATGRPCPVITAGRNVEENEKRIGAIMLAGQSVVSLDNIVGNLASALLCQALERPLVLVRILGASAIAEIEVRTTWFATGTNLKIVDDLTRRTVIARIDANTERPELRTFRNNPVATVMRERGRYIAACLTIVRAYVAAGKPGRRAVLASYAAWSDLVRSALVWLGRADPCDSMETIRAEDPDLEQRRAVFEAWPAPDIAYTTSELVDLADPESDFGKTEGGQALRESLHSAAPGAKGGINPTVLGKWLGANVDRIVNGAKLVRADARQGRSRWKIEIAKATGAT